MTVFVFQARGQKHIIKETIGKEVRSYCYIKEPVSHQMEWDGKFPVCPKCFQTMDAIIEGNQGRMERVEATERKLSWYRSFTSSIIDGQRPAMEYGPSAASKEGSFPFIPKSLESNMHGFYQLKQDLPSIKEWSGHAKKKRGHKVRFLDAGCGIGNVMATFDIFNIVSEIHGIEYFEETFEKARRFLGVDTPKRRPHYKLFKDDILKFPDYKKYDIIYFYCPFSDHRLQLLFEEKVEDDMRVGGILLCNLKKSHIISKDSRFKQLKGRYAEVAFIKVKGGPREVSDKDYLISDFSKTRTGNEQAIIDKYKFDAQSMCNGFAVA